MEVSNTQGATTALVKTDTIERKLRGAASMLSMLYGEGRQAFRALGEEYQDGFLDTLVDLTEDARRVNCQHV